MGLPVEVNNLMIGAVGGYQISRSLRFRSSASAYLNRTPASSGNRQIWTWSAWVKRGSLSSLQKIFSAYDGSNNATGIQFVSGDNLEFWSIQISPTTYSAQVTTTQVFRDPSAWYHIVAAIDTTQATASNRVKLYVNGVQITAFGTATYPSQNANLIINVNNVHKISSNPWTSPYDFYDGYLAEVNFIDGQALTPSSFGETDSITGVWNPKKYSGTYGTNGFYLNFSDNSGATATTIGKDSSGNGNNWTPNNISVTAGTTYDSMIDSPTPYADGGNGRGNYATFNPIWAESGYTNGTTSNGNLTVSSPTNTSVYGAGTIGVSSGKWYWEYTVGNVPSIGTLYFGLAQISPLVGTYVRAYRHDTGEYYNGSAWSAYGATFTTNDVIGVALDLDNQTLTFYKNNVSQGQKTSIGLTGITITSLVYSNYSPGSAIANFGQRSFSYTPPSGFKALNTYNLPAPSIANGAQYMAASLYTGNGGTAQTITNTVDSTSFQPDFVWIKSRNSASFSHRLYDSVRGVGKELYSNATNAESTVAQSLTAFASNGFTLGTDTNNNASGTTYVGWQWKGGGTAVTNNSGTITSQVSANTSAGISIITYTGNGTAGATVGHGLGVAPNLVIWKKRSSTANWFVWSKAADVAAGSTRWGYLNASNAFDTSASTNEYPTYKVDPTSTVLTVNGTGSSNGTNDSSATYVAYCFAAVRGYSAFGSYTGNGSTDGPFVYTGFRPRFIMAKCSTSAVSASWLMQDTSRDTYNVGYKSLYANDPSVESVSSNDNVDILSNGFKIRNASAAWNNSGQTFIYMAFAENPFNISRAR